MRLACSFVGVQRSLALGVVYSTDLPFLRWKRYPFMAATCIFLVRAVAVQLGFYLHMRCAVLGLPLTWTQPLLFGTAFMSLCSVVIALFKDIPDVAGDRIANVRTLSVRLGVPAVFNICRYVCVCVCLRVRVRVRRVRTELSPSELSPSPINSAHDTRHRREG
jgi:4-hydroxybenzoate polyprenyltransferase